jgi:hypothetical protein
LCRITKIPATSGADKSGTDQKLTRTQLIALHGTLAAIDVVVDYPAMNQENHFLELQLILGVTTVNIGVMLDINYISSETAGIKVWSHRLLGDLRPGRKFLM